MNYKDVCRTAPDTPGLLKYGLHGVSAPKCPILNYNVYKLLPCSCSWKPNSALFSNKLGLNCSPVVALWSPIIHLLSMVCLVFLTQESAFIIQYILIVVLFILLKPLGLYVRTCLLSVSAPSAHLWNPVYINGPVHKQSFEICYTFRDNKWTVFAGIVLYLNNPFGI